MARLKKIVLGVLTVCLLCYIPAIWFVWSRVGILGVMVMGTAAVLLYPVFYARWQAAEDEAALGNHQGGRWNSR